MREEIINNLDNPGILEKLYRDNKEVFKRTFNLIYPEVQEKTPAKFWNERLNFEREGISWGSSNELLFIIIAAVIAGFIAKIPLLFNIDQDYFYPRNISFIVFPFLTAYFAWKQKLQWNKVLPVLVIQAAAAIYINFLPDNQHSDTLILACIHLPLFMWSMLGFIFAGDQYRNFNKRLDFLKYNGDLVVMTAVMVLAGIATTAITFGLFHLIGVDIEKFFSEYVIIWGLSAAPLVGTYLVQTNPQLVNKVSPVIAKVFTPIVLVVLVVYLIAVVYTGKDPYNDRDFLLIFNLLLIGVMAIILFSVTEVSKGGRSRLEIILLLCLSVVTIIINGIALSAIIFRITEMGITPNRLAVLGGNILMLINLLMVSYKLFMNSRNREDVVQVEHTIAAYLPVYVVWTVIVTFLFPVLFSFS